MKKRKRLHPGDLVYATDTVPIWDDNHVHDDEWVGVHELMIVLRSSSPREPVLVLASELGAVGYVNKHFIEVV